MRKVLETLKNGKVKVQCDCGSIRTIGIYYFRKCPGARCQKCTGPENARKQTTPKHKGIGDISRKLYDYYRRTAKKRSLEFNISLRYMWDLFIEQKGKCVFTDLELRFARGTHNGINHLEMTASLDRKDSKKGYVKG